MHTETLNYYDEKTCCKAYIAYDKAIPHQRPAVLVAHAWAGQTDFSREKARQLAALGYVGFAIDMYGEGKTGSSTEENSALMKPFVEDRALLKKRILAAFETAAALEIVDKTRIGAMGYCFGGLCVLDLARSGADVKGVVSFHGLLGAPNFPSQKIKAKILALHGHDDPMVTPDQVLAFEKEMTQAGVDWQVHVYGNTMHAFTNPEANDPGFGTVYNATAAKRAWIAMKNFWEEMF